MLDVVDVKKTVDNKFWKHITKDTLFPDKQSKTKDKTIEKIVLRVNQGIYLSSGVKEFIIFSKSRTKANRIARIVPSFYVEDYVLLYYLLKKIEIELSQGIHPNAFGSFRNFKYFRDKEKHNHELLGWDSLPSLASASSFYKNYWIFEWKEFMGKARRVFKDPSYKFFIMFDIADFYSSINLLLLERKIRSAVSKEKQIFVDLLFYFLQHSNNKFKKYIPEMKGIPQDEVGDASRLLANFFLQSFDYDLNIFASKLNGKVLRYSDDHIIYARDEKSAEKILFYASIQLQKIGLSINGAKVKDYKSRSEFKNYWGFDIHDLLDKNQWRKGANEYIKRGRNDFRWETVLFRFLLSSSTKLDLVDYMAICKEFLDDSLVSTLEHAQILRLYNFLPKAEQNNFLIQLDKLISKTNFNVYHYNLIKAIDKNIQFKKYFSSKKKEKIKKRLKELKNYFD